MRAFIVPTKVQEEAYVQDDLFPEQWCVVHMDGTITWHPTHGRALCTYREAGMLLVYPRVCEGTPDYRMW